MMLEQRIGEHEGANNGYIKIRQPDSFSFN